MSKSAIAFGGLGLALGAVAVFAVDPLLRPIDEKKKQAPHLIAYIPPTLAKQETKPPPVPESTAPEVPRVSFVDARRAVRQLLRDPDSAQFGKVFQGHELVGKITVCGTVNSKNGYGGYIGMTPFVYFPDGNRAMLISMNGKDLLGTTDEGLRAHFNDCATFQD